MTLPDLRIPDDLPEAPDWALWAAAVATAAFSLAVMYQRLRRARTLVLPGASGPKGEAQPVAAAGPLAALGACGMALSLYGLYGFARDNMGLDWYWTIPLMAIFDLAEVTCFVSLYRSAAVESSWTRPMRRTRRMAWTLVAASAAMNAAHAPGDRLTAMVVFALVPVTSAKLIEFELDKRMSANGADDDRGDVGPGLARLVQVAYTRAWAGVFAWLGWDATTRDGLIHREARIRKAAKQLHQLRRALETKDKASSRREKKAAAKRVEELQGRAERAIDAAGIAGDTPAQLTLARALATRGRVVDLARMDVRDPMSIVKTLEELAIVPSAEAIAAGAAAAEAQQQQREAEKARDEARAEMMAAQAEADQVKAEADAWHAEAEAMLTKAQQTATEAEQRAKAAADRAKKADQLADQAEETRQQLAAQVEELRQEAAGIRRTTSTDQQTHQRLAQQLAELRDAIEQAESEARERRREADAIRTEAQQAHDRHQSARAEIEQAQDTLFRLQDQARHLQEETQKLADERRRHVDAIEQLETQTRAARVAARQAQDEAARIRAAAREAEETRRAATVALQQAREELMDALTDPAPYEPPRWTSPAKMRGWELYTHKVATEGVEPTDAELAGEERDPSTARKWLPEFRAELARRTAAALPAQASAHNRTAASAPAGV
ncbi:hypothetical protein ABZ508_34235 [Streptomyces lavendulocolor]|uniref:Chromosome partition protein Smc n=1 Tax=Streptomyces lavendulocolor TaxID=67316 RepID=A0ABV2WGG6_9ACTN